MHASMVNTFNNYCVELLSLSGYVLLATTAAECESGPTCLVLFERNSDQWRHIYKVLKLGHQPMFFADVRPCSINLIIVARDHSPHAISGFCSLHCLH